MELESEMPIKEPQYEIFLDLVKEQGLLTFGLIANDSWNNYSKKNTVHSLEVQIRCENLRGQRACFVG